MADEQLMQEIDRYVDEVWEDYIQDVIDLVAIYSPEDLYTRSLLDAVIELDDERMA